MESRKKTQLQIIRAHLKRYGSITNWEAINKYRITRLSEYIRVLRHDDKMKISCDIVVNKKTKTHYGVYKLHKRK